MTKLLWSLSLSSKDGERRKSWAQETKFWAASKVPVNKTLEVMPYGFWDASDCIRQLPGLRQQKSLYIHWHTGWSEPVYQLSGPDLQLVPELPYLLALFASSHVLIEAAQPLLPAKGGKFWFFGVVEISVLPLTSIWCIRTLKSL